MMVTNTTGSFTPQQSLRVRILLAISASVLLVMAGLIALGSITIKQMSLTQVRHEGILMAHAAEAAIVGLAAEGDVEGIQAYIDHLVSLREKNDLEINVMLLRDGGTDIVASNVPDNIEEADHEEHEATLAALASGGPKILVEVEDASDDDDDDSSSEDEEERALEAANRADPSHPDFYFPSGSRSIVITTPLAHNGLELGSVNTELSLDYLDTELAALTRSAWLALLIGCLVIAALLTPFLHRTVFKPLEQLAHRLYDFGTGKELQDVAPTVRRDEIGVLENEFYNMVARIKSADAMREELARVRTEQKEREMETKLRQAQKMEALGTLAGGIAHDFNNLLTPIMGYTELSLMKLPEDSELQEGLDEVIRASSRAKALVRQILTFSRQSEEERCPLQLGPLVKETLKFLRAGMPANIEVKHNLQDRDAVVMGSPTQIHQVILNLATNACQAMVEEGGSLDIQLCEAEFKSDTNVGDDTLAAGRYVKLTVADTGPGIDPHVVDRIFEPYFTTKAEGEGTGLGLSMVHGILKDMGGTVSVGSEVGKGTTFEAYFPVTEDIESAMAETAAGRIPTGNEKVLIVDDEEPIARMIGEMLGTLGYDATVCGTPVEALERLTSNGRDFDLVISDVAMPGMTGIELVRHLSECGVDIPIILCSAYTGGINWKTAGALGIQAMLMKPVRRADLGEKVREVLDGRESLPKAS